MTVIPRFSLQLFYFEKQSDKDPVGVIILEGCTVELAEEEIDKFAFKITFHGEGRRVYTMGTDDSVSCHAEHFSHVFKYSEDPRSDPSKSGNIKTEQFQAWLSNGREHSPNSQLFEI